MAASFKANRSAEREFLRMVQPAIGRKAEMVAAAARSIAPVLTGAYRNSIEVKPDYRGASVSAGVPYSMVVESRHNVLARALISERE